MRLAVGEGAKPRTSHPFFSRSTLARRGIVVFLVPALPCTPTVLSFADCRAEYSLRPMNDGYRDFVAGGTRLD